MVTKSRLKRVWMPGHIFESIFEDFEPILGAFLTHFGGQNAPRNLYKKRSVFGVISVGGPPPRNRVGGRSGMTLWGPGKVAICTKK